MNSLPSFVVIGSGLILGSTIDEIIKCGGNVKAIYLENTKDQKRFKNSLHVKNSQNINLDLNYLSENVDKNTWLISADSKKIISKEVSQKKMIKLIYLGYLIVIASGMRE